MELERASIQRMRDEQQAGFDDVISLRVCPLLDKSNSDGSLLQHREFQQETIPDIHDLYEHVESGIRQLHSDIVRWARCWGSPKWLSQDAPPITLNDGNPLVPADLRLKLRALVARPTTAYCYHVLLAGIVTQNVYKQLFKYYWGWDPELRPSDRDYSLSILKKVISGPLQTLLLPLSPAVEIERYEELRMLYRAALWLFQHLANHRLGFHCKCDWRPKTLISLYDSSRMAYFLTG
jgi:hypothetical protein